MKTYSIFNVKGGVGKTTSATTIAHLLATEYGKKVLLVDLDPQSNSSSLFSSNQKNILDIIRGVFVQGDLNVLKAFNYTVGDLLLNPALDVHDVIAHTEYENLDFTAGVFRLGRNRGTAKGRYTDTPTIPLESAP